jgi:hypothetical protein
MTWRADRRHDPRPIYNEGLCAGWTETNHWRHEIFNEHTLADKFRRM